MYIYILHNSPFGKKKNKLRQVIWRWKYTTNHCQGENMYISFHAQLNSMHPSLKFTVERESNHRLPFLYVFVHKTPTAFPNSGLYDRWDSFCPQQRKINLIKTFVYRALMISSKCFLGHEIKFIKSTLSKNGYPLSVLSSVVNEVTIKFDRACRCTVNRWPVYLRLPYIGSRGERLATAVGRCYFSDVLPPHHINSVIYKYTCSCGSDNPGKTSNSLDLRIRQHLSARILNLRLIRGQLENTSGSSIAEHMINSRGCVADFNVDRFSILSRSHSLFHLKLLETLYVRSLL